MNGTLMWYPVNKQEPEKALGLTELQLPEVPAADLLPYAEVGPHHEDAGGGGGAGRPRVATAPLGHLAAPHRPLALLLPGVIHDSKRQPQRDPEKPRLCPRQLLRRAQSSWDKGSHHRRHARHFNHAGKRPTADLHMRVGQRRLSRRGEGGTWRKRREKSRPLEVPSDKGKVYLRFHRLALRSGTAGESQRTI